MSLWSLWLTSTFSVHLSIWLQSRAFGRSSSVWTHMNRLCWLQLRSVVAYTLKCLGISTQHVAKYVVMTTQHALRFFAGLVECWLCISQTELVYLNGEANQMFLVHDLGRKVCWHLRDPLKTPRHLLSKKSSTLITPAPPRPSFWFTLLASFKILN